MFKLVVIFSDREIFIFILIVFIGVFESILIVFIGVFESVKFRPLRRRRQRRILIRDSEPLSIGF